MLIHAFVFSRFDYCNSLYIGISQTSISRLQVVQNAADRLLSGTRKYNHISSILASLGWLPIQARVDFKLLFFVYKSLNGLAPPYVSELLQVYKPLRSLRYAEKGVLFVPRTKYKRRGDGAFAVVAPKLWNNLPLHIRYAPTLGSSKRHFKIHFLCIASTSEEG